MLRRALLSLALLSACTSPRSAPPAVACSSASTSTDGGAVAAKLIRHDHPDQLKPCPGEAAKVLDRAIAAYDAGDYEDALACAAQAAARAPQSAPAHSERAAALVSLGRLDEARVAYARALAIDPNLADALLGTADLYIGRLPPSRDHNELGIEYAKRGRLNAKKAKDRTLVGQFSLLEAMGLNGVGRSADALARAEEALANRAEEGDARREKAAALYELCRFTEARAELEKLLSVRAHEPFARYYLGLIAERDGRQTESDRLMAEARKLAPDDFPPEVPIAPQEFGGLVAGAVRELPADMQRDLAEIPVLAAELPELDDLVSVDPPLSPAILGLFRGPSKGEVCLPADEKPGPCRAVVLYRKNLARAVLDRKELEEQVKVTLLHEVGHLRGEDDVQLAARGLE